MNLNAYMQRVYNLEKSCYEQQQLLSKMSAGLKQAQNPKRKAYTEDKDAKLTAGDIVAYIGTFLVFMLIWGIVCTVVIALLFGDFSSKKAEVAAVVAVALGIVLYIAYVVTDLRDKKKRRSAVRLANKNTDQYNQSLQKRMAVQASVLSQQIVTAQSTLASTRQLLQQYYSQDIIFPKYRNLVAVSMLYEYLSSGRCSQLEGHEGAYNLYEQEIRMNLILSKLDDVLAHLDRIESSQYELARAIREGNKKADQVYQSLQNVERNTAAAAYYSSISAANTTYLAWFKANT